MFKLHAVQARFGDSLIIEFGSENKPRFVLVDGGPPQCYEDALAPALQSIVGAQGQVELAVLSHVDNDHVVGLLDLLAALEEDHANDVPPRTRIKQLWHNSFDRSMDPTGEIAQRLQGIMALAGTAGVAMPFSTDALLGIREGYRLRTLATQLGIPVNKGFENDLITTATTKAPIKLGPLTLRIVGPTQENLEELRKEWLAWLAKTEADAAKKPSLAANADKSIPNLSSIIILAQCEGRTMLLTGDARGDHIITGLEQVKLLQKGKLHVDVLKLQHHGSNRNITQKFLETVTADTYVVSADGTHDNPDYDTLKWLLQAAKKQKREVEIVVTNATTATRQIVKDFKPASHGYTLTVRPKQATSVAVALA
jgi:beta-lactamase superfamily II metal-dependent hydrolase